MSIKDRVCQHLQASGLPSRESSRLAALTQKWVQQSGPVWAANRWKSLGNYAHQRLVNPSTPLPLGWAVRVNSRGRKILRDNFLHRVLELPTNPEPTMGQLRVIEAICRISSAILDENPTVSKLQRCCVSITKPSTGTKAVLPDNCYKHFVVKLLGKPPSEDCRKIIPLKATPASAKSSPFYWRRGTEFMMLKGRHDQNMEVISPTWFENTRFGREWLHKHQREFSLAIYGVADRYPMFMGNPEDLPYTLPVGSLAFLSKDGSGKTRVVANACLDIQACLKPLQNILEIALKRVQASAVHDQESGKQWVKRQLEAGKTCYGFDQSAFTDRFPYSLQRKLLEIMKNEGWPIKDSDLELLDHCVSSYWTANQARMAVKYAVGQPMGLNPSFALATLSHLVVVHYLTKRDRKSIDDLVRIVGDDIVISDDDIASRYEELMVKDLGVSINRDKSLNSSFITQFCGKLITRFGEVPSTKIRPIDSDESLAAKLNHYGVDKVKFFAFEAKAHPKTFLPKPLGQGIRLDTISYSDWIRQESYDSKGNPVDASTLSREMDAADFYGPSGLGCMEAHERTFRWEYMNPTFVVGDSFSPLGEDSSEMNEDSSKEDNPPVNCHAYLDDMACSSELGYSLPEHIFNKFGYIDPKEKPSQVNSGRDGLGTAEALRNQIEGQQAFRQKMWQHVKDEIHDQHTEQPGAEEGSGQQSTDCCEANEASESGTNEVQSETPTVFRPPS